VAARVSFALVVSCTFPLQPNLPSALTFNSDASDDYIRCRPHLLLIVPYSAVPQRQCKRSASSAPNESSPPYLLHTSSGAPRGDRHHCPLNCRSSGGSVVFDESAESSAKKFRLTLSLPNRRYRSVAFAVQASIQEIQGTTATTPNL
jgi:hypothetical protein